MKHCPKCSKTYSDETLNFCLDDGEWLREASDPGEPATAILHETDPPSEAATRAQIHETDRTASVPSGIGQWKSTPIMSGRKFGIIAGLVIAAAALGFFGYSYFASDSKPINSIAVLPFANASGDKETEYLGEGLSESLINSFTTIPQLKVTARSTAFRYRGREGEPLSIGKELGVGSILTGSLLERGDSLNIQVDLVSTSDGSQIWGKRYSGKSSEIVGIQQQIAKDVSEQLRLKLTGTQAEQVTKTHTADPEAYQLYLKGEYHWHKRGYEEMLKAADYFNQAIEKDPGYALAYAGLALTYTLGPDWGNAPPETSHPKAKAAALRALELDGSLAEPHAVLGMYFSHAEWNWAEAEKEFRRAIELKPDYATAHQWLSTEVLIPQNRLDEAIAEGKRARELDPLSAIISTRLGYAFFVARRYDEAIAMHRRSLDIDPNFSFAHNSLGNTLLAKGQYNEAIAASRKAVELSINDPWDKGYLAFGLAKAGHRDEAIKIIEELKHPAADIYVPAIVIALPYLALGNKEESLAWLEKEVAAHGSDGPTTAADPNFDDLRSDPRFKALLKRMNLPE